jgi:hypothetical protein
MPRKKLSKEERLKRRRERQARYQLTEKGIATWKRWNRSWRARETDRRYHSSAKGIETVRRSNKTKVLRHGRARED